VTKPLENQPGQRVHLPALDGMRAVAIGLVLCVHATLYLGMTETTGLDRFVHRLFLAGFTGVDLFFALSGFLITGILLEARGEEGALKNFYGRRFLRIVPPYYLLLAFNFLVVEPLLPAALKPAVATSQAWYWTYFSNVEVAIDGWKNLGLSHFWSLAVEEQFYLLWPLAVLHLSTKALGKWCLALALLAPALRIICWRQGWPEAAYVLTPCRMDALTLGALVAVAMRLNWEPARILRVARRAGLFALLGILAIAIVDRGFTTFDPLVYTLGLSLTAIGSAALVAIARLSVPGHWLVRGLSNRAMREIGKVSYSMYILHVPILCLMALFGLELRKVTPWHGTLVPWLVLDLLIASAIIFLAALAAWHLYEKRLLQLKRYFVPPSRRSSA
jgi:peptidoglycan/LPS O-acetylase OafA/YrhL